MKVPNHARALCTLALVGSAAQAQPPEEGQIVTWAPAAYPWLAITPPPGSFVKIAAGSTHGLALRADGTVVGFGDNSVGQATPPPDAFAEIAAGGKSLHGHSYGIRPDGSVEHWGEWLQSFSTPPAGPFLQASPFGRGVLLLHESGEIVQWGMVPISTQPLPGPFIGVALGGGFAVGIRPDGTLAAWGDNSFGQLNVPPGAFTAVAAGATHAIAIRADGTLAGWGTPGDVPPGTFRSIAVASPMFPDWNLGLRTDGSIATWGNYLPGLEVTPHGRFIAVGATESSAIALAGCYADCNDDSALTVADFACFQAYFVQSSNYADCTGDGQRTIADFACFQAEFVTACR